METKVTLWLGTPGITDSQTTAAAEMNELQLYFSILDHSAQDSKPLNSWFEKVRLGMVIYNLTNIALQREKKVP